MIMLLLSAVFAGPPISSPASMVFDFLNKYQAQQFVIPFLLTFVIVYGVLDTINIFKKNSINSIIALAISFFAISAVPYGAMGQFLTNLYGTGAIAIVGLVIFMIILGALSLGGNRYNSSIFGRLFGESGGMIVGLVVTIIMIFLLSTGWFENIGIKLDSDTTTLIIIVLIIMLLFYIITRPATNRTKWYHWFAPPYSQPQP